MITTMSNTMDSKRLRDHGLFAEIFSPLMIDVSLVFGMDVMKPLGKKI